MGMEWKECKLGDYCDAQNGFAFNSISFIEDGKYNVIKIKELKDGGILFTTDTAKVDDSEKIEKYKVYKDDVLFALTGDPVGRPNPLSRVGRVSRYNNTIPAVLNQRVCKLLFSSEIDSKFVYYYFRQDNVFYTLASCAKGSASQANISTKDILNTNIRIPQNIEDQRRIADILSSLDAKIENNNKINAKLEEMAQALFKSWLSTCEDEVTIGDLSLNITDYTKCDKERVVLINSSDVTEGKFDHHNYSENKDLKGHFKKRFKKGDILYSQVRPRNRHWAYCTVDGDDYLASTQLMVIRNNADIIPSILLYQYIISEDVWMEFTLKTETRSGTFPQGNYEEISSIKVPFGADCKEISEKLDSIYAKVYSNVEENRRLTSLRDTLLPKLMSGEIEL